MSSQLIICILVIALSIITTRLLIIERKLRSIQPIYQYLKHLINSIPELTWIKDTQSRFLFVNSQFSKAFALPKKDIIGKTDFDLCSDPEQAQAYMEDDLNILRDGKILQIQIIITYRKLWICDSSLKKLTSHKKLRSHTKQKMQVCYYFENFE